MVRRERELLGRGRSPAGGSRPSRSKPAMSEDLAWKLLELGRVIDPPKTAALYAPMQEKEPYKGVKIERDVKYGPAERHLLDVFMPETAVHPPRPVLIYHPRRRLRRRQQAQPRPARSTTTSCCGR